jgi:pantoate--beta-alanine ligase
MVLFKTKAELHQFLKEARNRGQEVGFVPTMGALHPGHISLITRAKSENNLVVCSIFVNPTQFNDPKDLERYPITPEKDSRLLEEAGCDVLFLPNVKEMYPDESTPPPSPDLGSLDKVMEGKLRPGHFQGVVQIVSRLFDAVQPHRAYFGQKDFQQLAIIRQMSAQLGYKTLIIGCPIIREPDGLAMSSRNVLLTPTERKLARAISQTLFLIKELTTLEPVPKLLALVSDKIASVPGMTLEYFEIVNAVSLLPVNEISDAKSVVACIAVKLGSIRLIDNILLK